MNNANAAAKKRRANIQSDIQVRPQSSPQFQQQNQSNGLTLQQVVLLTDQRLTILESFMNELSEKNNQTVDFDTDNNQLISKEFVQNIDELFDDATKKFEILAQEISQLKDDVMKLQTYTMDVNKTLLNKLNILNDPTAIEKISLTSNETTNPK